MTTPNDVLLRTFQPSDPRLGRHVEHDPRSLRAAFAAPVLPKSVLAPAAWTPGIGILDQGNLGSCVANTGTELLSAAFGTNKGVDHVTLVPAAIDWQANKLGYTAFGHADDWALDEDFAQRLYAICTRTDSVSGSWTYPSSGEDTGSTGLGLAKALVGLGLAATTYQHAFSVQAIQTGLQTQPVPIGVVWFNSMFTPTVTGEVDVNPASGEAGGHEILICAWDAQGRYWFPNHWGQWGVAAPAGCGIDKFGWAYFTEQGMQTLFKSQYQGDATIITPLRSGVTPPNPPQPGSNPFRTALAAYPGLAEELARLGQSHRGGPKMDIETYTAWRLAGELNFR
jgi:hypothetical protein